MLPLEWRAENAREIADTVARLKDLMNEQNLGLSEAFRLIDFGVKKSKNKTNWKTIAENFLSSRKDRRETSKKDLRKRVTNAFLTLGSMPKHRDGRSLFRSYAEQHFDNCPAGGQGRNRYFGDVAAFLCFGVQCGSCS